MKEHNMLLFQAIGLVLGLVLLLQIPVSAMAYETAGQLDQTAQTLSVKEESRLSQIDEALCEEPEVLELKKAGVLGAFVAEAEAQEAEAVSGDMDETMARITPWGISPDNTVNDVKAMAQAYLNTHFDGIQIGSPEFDEMVHLYMDNEALGVDKLADEQPEFGPLYLYMCICAEYVLADDVPADRPECLQANSIGDSSILNVVADDCRANYVSTDVRSILRNYVQTYSTRSAWDRLNGSQIQAYARQYAKSFNPNYIQESADCTNFVSQALYNGGLQKTFTMNDNMANGYVNTDERWFYFKTNSSLGFRASTSWVRVVELYNYLAPHYASHETTNGNEMNAYLNAGFVIQGKKLIGAYSHSAICTTTNGQQTYCAHSSPAEDKPMSEFYNYFHKYRVIQTY